MEIMTSGVRREVRGDSGMPYIFVNNFWSRGDKESHIMYSTDGSV